MFKQILNDLRKSPLHWKVNEREGIFELGTRRVIVYRTSIILEDGNPRAARTYQKLGPWGRWRINRAIKALLKIRQDAEDFTLTVEEELLLEEEFGETRMLAAFAELERADLNERKKVKESPVVNGFFRGAIRTIKDK